MSGADEGDNNGYPRAILKGTQRERADAILNGVLKSTPRIARLYPDFIASAHEFLFAVADIERDAVDESARLAKQVEAAEMRALQAEAQSAGQRAILDGVLAVLPPSTLAFDGGNHEVLVGHAIETLRKEREEADHRVEHLIGAFDNEDGGIECGADSTPDELQIAASRMITLYCDWTRRYVMGEDVRGDGSAKDDEARAEVMRLRAENAALVKERDELQTRVRIMSELLPEPSRVGEPGRRASQWVPRCTSMRTLMDAARTTERCCGALGHRSACFGGVPPPPSPSSPAGAPGQVDSATPDASSVIVSPSLEVESRSVGREDEEGECEHPEEASVPGKFGDGTPGAFCLKCGKSHEVAAPIIITNVKVEGVELPPEDKPATIPIGGPCAQCWTNVTRTGSRICEQCGEANLQRVYEEAKAKGGQS